MFTYSPFDLILSLPELKTLEWNSKTEFKEFEPRLKFETRIKYGWFHLKLY